MLSPHHNHRVNGEKQKGRSQTRLLTGLLAATGWRSRPPCGPHPPCSAQTQGPDQTRWWWAGTAWAGGPSGTRRKAPMQGASQRSLHHGSHAHPNTLLSFWVLKGVSFPTNHWFHHKKMRRPHEIQLSKLRPLTDCRFLHGTCGLCSEWTRQGPARLFRNSEERGAHTLPKGTLNVLSQGYAVTSRTGPPDWDLQPGTNTNHSHEDDGPHQRGDRVPITFQLLHFGF